MLPFLAFQPETHARDGLAFRKTAPGERWSKSSLAGHMQHCGVPVLAKQNNVAIIAALVVCQARKVYVIRVP